MSAKLIAFSPSWARTEVRCYSGYKLNQAPVALFFKGRWLEVDTVLDRWYDPDCSYFKVRTKDMSIYLLKWDMGGDIWMLKPMKGETSYEE